MDAVDYIPPDEVLPCGCILRCSIEEGIKTFTFVPCHLKCINYKNAIKLAKEAGVRIERREAHER